MNGRGSVPLEQRTEMRAVPGHRWAVAGRVSFTSAGRSPGLLTHKLTSNLTTRGLQFSNEVVWTNRKPQDWSSSLRSFFTQCYLSNDHQYKYIQILQKNVTRYPFPLVSCFLHPTRLKIKTLTYVTEQDREEY